MSDAGPGSPPAVARPRNLQELVEVARRRGPRRLAVAAADEASCLTAVAEAAQLGLVTPLLVGSRERIGRAAAQAGVKIDGFELLEVPDDAAAATAAVRLVHDGAADLVMKGSLATRILLRAVLDREFGLRTHGVLSHVSAFDAPDNDRLILLTDAAVNVNPSFGRKIEIVTNALEAARRLGLVRPKVAVLAAVEKLELPAMPATLDAEMLRRLGESGFFGDALIAGPMSLDAALSADRSAHKGLTSPVAGAADVLVCPNIETANNLYKAITCIARREIAGAVVGVKSPVIVPSRADTPLTKLYGIALAALLCGEESPA